jgi:hypothetical protein
MPQVPDAGHADGETLASYALDPTGADDAVADHIATCATCSAEVAWYTSLLRVGDLRRNRVGCPTAQTILAYALDELSGPARREAAAHVARCVHCAAEVLTTREALPLVAAAAQEQEGALTRARRILATLLPLAPSSDPALALRGPADTADEEGAPRTFAAEGVELSLRHERERGAFVLYGTIAGNESAELSRPLSARLLSAPAGGDAAIAELALVAEVPIEFRAFEFHDVAPGAYQLEVLFPDRVIVVAALTM